MSSIGGILLLALAPSSCALSACAAQWWGRAPRGSIAHTKELVRKYIMLPLHSWARFENIHRPISLGASAFIIWHPKDVRIKLVCSVVQLNTLDISGGLTSRRLPEKHGLMTDSIRDVCRRDLNKTHTLKVKVQTAYKLTFEVSVAKLHQIHPFFDVMIVLGEQLPPA
jgi:hypothetical protein